MIPNKKRKYYVLAVWHKHVWEEVGKWGVEFGSYDRKEVEQEKADMHDVPRRWKQVVVCVSDSQRVINDTVSMLEAPKS